MSDTNDPKLCSLITNVCKLPKNFDFPKTEQPFKFVCFEQFPWVCYSRWENKTYCLPCVLFGRKNGEKSLQKTISSMTNISSNIQKTSKCSNGTHKKRQILFHRFLGEYTLFLPPSSF